MDKIKGDKGNRKPMFISDSLEERAVLNRVIHFGSSQGIPVVDAIRKRRLFEIRAAFEKAEGIPAELRVYFDVLNDSETVTITGNHDIALDRDCDEHPSGDHFIAHRLFDGDDVSRWNVNRIVRQPPEADSAHSISPPINIGGVLSIFMSGQKRDSFVGDLQERYVLIFESAGRRSATVWYYREIMCSFRSLCVESLKRLSGFEKLIARNRRIGS